MNTKLFNPVLDFITTLCNYIALNVVFLITCLPVVTIGAALSSLYCVTLKEARGEYGYLVQPYLKEFKKNLKSGTAAFVILFIIGAALLFGTAFWFSIGSIPSTIAGTLMAVGCLFWLLTFTYTFPLIARFENTTRQTLKNAFAFTICYPKATISLIIIDIIVIAFCLFMEPMKIIMVLFGFSFIAYCQSFIFKKLFEPYEKAQDSSCTSAVSTVEHI